MKLRLRRFDQALLKWLEARVGRGGRANLLRRAAAEYLIAAGAGFSMRTAGRIPRKVASAPSGRAGRMKARGPPLSRFVTRSGMSTKGNTRGRQTSRCYGRTFTTTRDRASG